MYGNAMSSTTATSKAHDISVQELIESLDRTVVLIDDAAEHNLAI